MTRIISILNPKGGAGKTTLATNIADYLHKSNKVLLVDTDPQGTLREWKNCDTAEVKPDLIVIDRPNLQKDLSTLASHFDYVVIDGAAKLESMITFAVKVSDVVLVPVQPSLADFWACDSLVELLTQRRDIAKGKPDVAFIISRQTEGSKMASSILDELKAFNFPIFKNRTTQRVVYSEAISNGKSVFDYDNSKAKQEIIKIVEELCQLIN
jgi:chromosome partitioning protein